MNGLRGTIHVAVSLGLLAVPAVGVAAEARVEFGRDILPILSDACFFCHGPDPAKRKAGLRLDIEKDAKADLGGYFAIVPGDPQASDLIKRILSSDPEQKMPPPDSNRSLKPGQVELIRKWIEQGAMWQSHWAFTAPVRPAVPKVAGASWIKTPIDQFILAKLEQEGIEPSPVATRQTLIRRVTLDLTGLPPTPREVEAFLGDGDSDAYEKVVDRLLRSPHYGERMALPWLDAARYADSNGFQQDGDTYQYIWRDWVVRALNDNMPFDRFTVEQLAGDLLPDATDEQRLASAFNRNHLLNGEGGAIPEEQRNVILFDRVDVTSTNWLGLTMACAQCHDHKYDPVTQLDYFNLFAYFNNVPEAGVPRQNFGTYRLDTPWIFYGDNEQNAGLKGLLARLESAKAAWLAAQQSPQIQAAQDAWESAAAASQDAEVKLDAWHSIGPFAAANFDAAYQQTFEPEKGVKLDAAYRDGKLKWVAQPQWADGRVHALQGENAAFYLYRTIHSGTETLVELSLGSDDAIKVWHNGAEVLANKALRAAAADQEKITLRLRPGDNPLLLKIVNGGALAGFYFRLASVGLPQDIAAVLKSPREARTEPDEAKVRQFFLTHHAPDALAQARQKQESLTKEVEAYRQTLPRVMVMSDDGPRKTRLLDRGNYLMPLQEVEPDTPGALPPMPGDSPRNRLGLARWLVAAENPLTTRVQVNRYWQHFFGIGLVKTSENFGVQSEPPSHPQLLDWLAVEFRERGWDVKHMHKLIVTSATYMQSSATTRQAWDSDPENRLLARGARFRMPSMVLRDVALASSGLLDTRLGGKPVYPYQPGDIWDGLAITKERDFTYPQSQGADLYRRSLYTFWRRTVSPGNMFDAATRQTCQVRASVTSTPLHALTTLNDPTWVEAGRVLAQRVMKEAGPSADARLAEAYRRVCARRPDPLDLKVLRGALQRALAEFQANPSDAMAYLKIGDSPADPSLDSVELAAYASVCLAIYNLDEALTRE